MRWPFMTKAEHDKIVDALQARLDSAIKAITAEHARATKDGMAKVHAFMRDANAELYSAEGSSMYVPKVRAVLQQAEREFRPGPPTTLSEVLYAPANLKEAIDRATATA